MSRHEPAPAYTLQLLAAHLGWGERMTDEAIWRFIVKRELLLRDTMALLETHKSDAATAELAIKDRIETLKAAPEAGTRPAWQPIETAPKDVPILIAVRGKNKLPGLVGEASYSTEEEGWFWAQENAFDHSALTSNWTPTHWMPLPQPPEGSSNV